MPALYRPNVAALIVNREGLLLVCERSGCPGAWQFPQGGIDPGESAREAAEREIGEEVGYMPSDYDIAASAGGYRYDYPPEVLDAVQRKRGEPYVGQEQTYFLCRLRPGAGEPVLDGREFGRHAWIAPGAFRLGWLPEFKRGVYRDVLSDFFRVAVEG